MTLAALLHRRHAVGQRAALRRRSTSIPAAGPPRAEIRAMTKLLAGVSSELDDAIEQELAAARALPRTDSPADGDPPMLLPGHVAGIVDRLSRIVDRILARRSLLAPLDDIAARTSAWTRVQWARQVRAALGVDLPAGDPDMAALFADFRARNVALIRSLAADKVARVHKVLTEAGSSTRVEDIAKALRAETGATASRAALIARDQVLKLNGEVTQARHVAAGVTEYIWRTSRDERVREAHKALDGTRQRYGEPPVVDPRTGRREPPGRDFQCRCTAEPLIPGFDGG